MNAIIQTIVSKIALLTSPRKIAHTEALQILYNAIVQPYFEKSDILYDSTSKTNKKRQQQNLNESL